MAHVFDVMASLTGQLNVLTGHYCNNTMLNGMDTIPTFIAVALDRNKRFTDLKDDEDLDISSAIISNTHDIFNPLYVVTVINIKEPMVLKLPTNVVKGDQSGPAIATLVVLPRLIFDEDTDVKVIADILKKVYFGVLNTDPNMSFEVTDMMLSVGNKNDNKLFIPTYDLTMLYVVYGFIYIYIKNYFNASSDDIVNIILGEDYDEASRSNLSCTLQKNASSISSLREAFGYGTILSDALYE
nr:MAG TPA: hypothetical protein [Caudoviricetes sp.]